MAQSKTAGKTKVAGAVNNARIITSKDLGFSDEKRCFVAPETFALAIRVMLQNWRQGTVGCKDRSEVNRTNKKPWKQKGTGRARAGSARSIIWRGGGVSFGPQPRVKTLRTQQKVKQSLFNALTWDRLDKKQIIMIDSFAEHDVPKTSLAFAALKNAGLHNKKITLFVTPDDYQVHASFANIPNVQLLMFDQPNVYSLSYGDFWVVLAKNNDSFTEMVSAWI